MSDLMFSSGLILLGMVGLVIGGEWLVRGASNLAVAARISPLVIGITLVSFGTSAPELAVTVQAAYAGSSQLAVGNLVGSNIANVLLILGAAALVAPLSVHSRIVKVDVPMSCAAAVGLWLLAQDGGLSRLDGLLLFAILVVYLVWSVRQGRGEDNRIRQQLVDALMADDRGPSAAAVAEVGQGAGTLIRQGLLVIGGLILLVAAARLMVTGASEIARGLGVSELVIGLTVVALGTSLPELVASALASLRGQGDIAVGNVVGSNLFNILAVLGIGAMVAPGGIPVSTEVLQQDLPIMIAATFVCLPIFFTDARVSRIEGLLLLGYYIAYIAYLTMGATDAAHTRSFEVVMLGFVIPLTMLAIGAGVYQSVRAR